MNANEFFDVVVKMREAQKNYFKTKRSDYLSQSKQLEKQIDDEIKRVNEVIQKKSNHQLF